MGTWRGQGARPPRSHCHHAPPLQPHPPLQKGTTRLYPPPPLPLPLPPQPQSPLRELQRGGRQGWSMWCWMQRPPRVRRPLHQAQQHKADCSRGLVVELPTHPQRRRRGRQRAGGDESEHAPCTVQHTHVTGTCGQLQGVPWASVALNKQPIAAVHTGKHNDAPFSEMLGPLGSQQLASRGNHHDLCSYAALSTAGCGRSLHCMHAPWWQQPQLPLSQSRFTSRTRVRTAWVTLTVRRCGLALLGCFLRLPSPGSTWPTNF
jgi:hypothetical protein